MPTLSLDTAYKDMLAENPHLSAEMLESAINSLLSGETDEGPAFAAPVRERYHWLQGAGGTSWQGREEPHALAQ